VVGYCVQRSASAQGPWVDCTGIVKETFALDIPPDASDFYYRVVGVIGADILDLQSLLVTHASNVGLGRLGTSAVPGAPRGLTATTSLTLQVRVSWQSVAGAVRYLVVRSTSPTQGPYDVIDQPEGTSTIDLPPLQGVDAFYRVAAVFADDSRSVLSAAVRGRTGTSQPINLAAERGQFPANPDGTPQTMVSGRPYEWPFVVVTNESDQVLPGGTAQDPGHIFWVGLMQPAGDFFDFYDVGAWFIPNGFPADTSVFADRLPFDFPPASEIPPGTYYWVVGFFLTESGERRLGSADSNWSDNEVYLLSPVQVRAR
jgi:hypothetical protein